MPGLKLDALAEADKSASLSRWFVAGTGAVIGISFLIVSLTLSSALPSRTTMIEKLAGADPNESTVVDSASIAELKQNWTRFRGPDGGGNAPFTNLPTVWDGTTGSGIAWKISTPASGYSSPIAWRDRIFFSGASESERAVYCLDANTGQVLWHESITGVVGAAKTDSEGAAWSSYATSTMATDGRRVYAFFGTGELAAFSMDGKPSWSKGLGPLKNAYGHAASLILWREKLILQLDQGTSQEGKSKLYAFDGRDGKILWQRPRGTGSSWATPIVIEAAGRTQIITLAVPSVIAYAVADGSELWRVEGLNGEVTPSPAFGAGLVFAVSPSEKLLAIRPDGSGDISKSNVVWSTDENVPDITSPICDGDLVFTLATSGMLSCFSATEGKKQWEHDFEMEFNCSPSLAAGRVYLFGTKGTAIVVEAARKFKELLRTEMGDVFKASPAFAEHRIILRGETNIWCIGPVGGKLARKE
jgi:outer membrane protein assembly factor BamB